MTSTKLTQNALRRNVNILETGINARVQQQNLPCKKILHCNLQSAVFVVEARGLTMAGNAQLKDNDVIIVLSTIILRGFAKPKTEHNLETLPIL